MFSKEILTKLSERTKEGSIEWQVVIMGLNTKKYEAVKSSLEFRIVSSCWGKEAFMPCQFILEVRKNGKVLLNDSGDWIKDGVNEESADMMQALICLIEEQEAGRKKAMERQGKESTTDYILRII